MKTYNFKAIIELDEDGNYIASVPSVPGCYSSGKTFEESMKNINEALELCLEEAEDNLDYKMQISYPSESNVFSVVELTSNA